MKRNVIVVLIVAIAAAIYYVTTSGATKPTPKGVTTGTARVPSRFGAAAATALPTLFFGGQQAPQSQAQSLAGQLGLKADISPLINGVSDLVSKGLTSFTSFLTAPFTSRNNRGVGNYERPIGPDPEQPASERFGDEIDPAIQYGPTFDGTQYREEADGW
jgi:hypothetical protein